MNAKTINIAIDEFRRLVEQDVRIKTLGEYVEKEETSYLNKDVVNVIIGNHTVNKED